MHILITNDDGIHSFGLRVLAQRLGKIGRVSVIAPDRERSATGHAITVHHPLRLTPYPNFAENVESAMSLDGTPSDCVKIGVEAVLATSVDLVVSGLNPGPNLGTDLLYSGTVAGAVEAVLSGIPAIAASTMSLTVPTEDLEQMADWLGYLVRKVHQQGLPRETLLNVNFPDCPWEKIKGVRLTRPGVRRYQNVFDKRVDPRGRIYYWMAGDPVDLDEGEDTDAAAVRAGYISISPVRFNLSDPAIMEEMTTWQLQV
ncbi:MAG: 5'/3'-nucleotidase SurE [Firmicutes bacterium]|nr:5'/3'-nucleotidase SurE [Bacillota bacterium]